MFPDSPGIIITNNPAIRHPLGRNERSEDISWLVDPEEQR